MEPDPDPDEEIIGDLSSAMEALSPRKGNGQSSPPRDSANKEPDAPSRDSANEESDAPPMKMNSPLGVSVGTPEKQRRRLEDKRIASFRELIRTDVDGARAILTRCYWDVDLAVGVWVEHHSGERVDWLAIDEFARANRYPMSGQSQYQDYSRIVDVQLTELDEILNNAPTSSRVKIQNIQESSQFWNDTRFPAMNTWVDRICSENKVCREEALYYLEGFNWNFGLAMEACRRKTLLAPIDDGTSSMMDNTGPPLPTLQYQAAPQIQLKEGEIGRSCSSVNTDPQETQRLLKKACEENITVAIPGVESSKVEGKAIEEGSTMATPPGPSDIQDTMQRWRKLYLIL